MIRLIQGACADAHASEMDSMFRARAEVFRSRLGWNVAVVDGREFDRYDQANPLYLLSIDPENGDVRGSLRLLPTTGPNMLRDEFGNCFDQPVDIESPTIWECTRFCLHPQCTRTCTATGAMLATWELMLGICEVGLLAGLTQIQGVYDRSMIRVYRKTRWSPTPIASSKHFGPMPVYVGLWEVSEKILARMRDAADIHASVIEESNEISPLPYVA